jgi:DNA-binding Xre family transcriptional regulator
MIKAHFNNIQRTLIEELQKAEQSIKIAVAWFNSKPIFDVLVNKIHEGVKIEIVLNYDFINFSLHCLNFQMVINLDCKIYVPKNEGGIFIHHKFCIIDKATTITGSYNWTNKAESNIENIVIHYNNIELAKAYAIEFAKLTHICNKLNVEFEKIIAPRDEKEKIVAAIENNYTSNSILDLIERLSKNNKIKSWFVKPGTNAIVWNDCLTNSYFRYGEDEAMKELMTIYNKDDYDAIAYVFKEILNSKTPPGYTHSFINEVKMGDIFFACKGRSKIIGLGIVKSKPIWKPEFDKLKTIREMQWLINRADNPIQMESSTAIAINTITHCYNPKLILDKFL